MNHDSFRSALTTALTQAIRSLEARIGDERLYVVAVYTSGETDFGYVAASANTEERLGTDGSRWSACDWHYHDFDERVSALELPAEGGVARDAALYEDMVSALSSVPMTAGVTRLILCGDMSDAFFRRGLGRLNPPAVVEAYIRDYTSDALFSRFDKQPVPERAGTLLALWRDLSLEIDSEAANEARRCGASRFDVERRLVAADSPEMVAGLLDLIESTLLAEPWNEKGSIRFRQRGICSVESELATSSVFLLRECTSLAESDVARLLAMLAVRVAADAELTLTSTLAENIARVLHQRFPERFPKPQKDSETNRLQNPQDFVSEGALGAG